MERQFILNHPADLLEIPGIFPLSHPLIRPLLEKCMMDANSLALGFGVKNGGKRAIYAFYSPRGEVTTLELLSNGVFSEGTNLFKGKYETDQQLRVEVARYGVALSQQVSIWHQKELSI